jgi:hypothetical protein
MYHRTRLLLPALLGVVICLEPRSGEALANRSAIDRGAGIIRAGFQPGSGGGGSHAPHFPPENLQESGESPNPGDRGNQSGTNHAGENPNNAAGTPKPDPTPPMSPPSPRVRPATRE